MDHTDYYNRHGEPISMEEWGKLYEQEDYRRVAFTTVDNPEASDTPIKISTVWLGMDHGWGDTPIIFETMIFGGAHSEWQHRYARESEALLGHHIAVKMVQDTITGEHPTADEIDETGYVGV